MRQGARVLQHLWRLAEKYGHGEGNGKKPVLINKPMEAFLVPEYFNWVVEAAILCGAGADEHGVILKPGELKAPSATLKVGFDIACMAKYKNDGGHTKKEYWQQIRCSRLLAACQIRGHL